MRLFIFGEDTANLHLRIRHQLIAARGNTLLEQLFHKTARALRHEVAGLAVEDRLAVPSFNTLDELNDRSEGIIAHAGICNTLFFISGIASYIISSTEHHAQAGQGVAVGISTGSLAAVTVALSPSIPTLIPFAAEVCLVAFQIGLHVQKTVQALRNDESGDLANRWTSVDTTFREHEMHEMLRVFQSQAQQAMSKLLNVSSSGPDHVTISGPSAVINRFKGFHNINTSQILSEHRSMPYHTPQLANREHALTLSKPVRQSKLICMIDSHQQGLSLVTSTINSKAAEHRSALSLFEEVIHETLRLPCNVLHITERLSNHIEDFMPSSCHLINCGATRWQRELFTSLHHATSLEFEITDNPWAEMFQPNDHRRTSKHPQLAIVGMAGRFPDAADHEKLWDLLRAGLDVHREVPSDRFDVKKYFDPASKTRNTSHTPYGCWIEEPGLFDPRFFNMSPREATQTDPMHRLGLVTAYEALEMAGYVPNRTPSTRLDRIGTFYGQTSDDWREINAAQDVDTYFITGGVRAFAPGRINYYFKFTGPSFNIDTACSSSAAAIQLACTSLWAGDCDTAVAGGLNIMTNSDIFSGLSRGQFLSKTGNCQTYDNDADGYCRGDGIGSIIIKRLEDAEADNDRVLGVISGIRTNHSSNAVSITHPHAPTQQELFARVMSDAGLDTQEVDYVEMHGTGTQAGDSTEMESVTNTFAPPNCTGIRSKPLYIGSVKANVGHGEAVSGVTAVVKAILMMQNNTIPPHCGIKGIRNQGFPKDLDQRKVKIALKPTNFLAQGGPRRIFVNNFSAAGGNTAMLLEDAPIRADPSEDPRSHLIVAVSAKSKVALSANVRNLVQHISRSNDIRLADLSYTTTARRIQHQYRVAFACDSVSKAVEVLTSSIDASIEPVSSIKPVIAFAYTGQGSHYSALAKQMFDLSSVFKANLISLNEISMGLGYPSFLPLVEGTVDATELSPLVLQLGLTSIQIALTRWWSSVGVQANIVTGHSLGEYAALNAAGVLSAFDTIYLVGERAKLLQDKCMPGTHAMLAVKSPANEIEDYLLDLPNVEFACFNGPSETVMAGPNNDIDVLASELGSKYIKCTKLDTSFAFHSAQIDPILDDYEKVTRHVLFNRPKIPVISPLLAKVLVEEEDVHDLYLSQHARDPVNFSGGLIAAQQAQLVNERTVWVELGPHPVCSAFLRTQFGRNAATIPTLRRSVAPYQSIAEGLSALHVSGLDIGWHDYHRDFMQSVRMLDLPVYAWDSKTYWIQYSGDWNLRKGELAAGNPTPEPETSKLSTTSMQKIVSESIDKTRATVVVESNISEPRLAAAISGHKVNGTALCPSSLYADMAMTLGDYVQSLIQPATGDKDIDVGDMEVFKPFIKDDAVRKDQILRLTASAPFGGNKGSLLFSSGSGKSEVQHAKCNFIYGSKSQCLSRWQRQSYLIDERISHLERAASSGQAHRMLRGIAYKLFGAFVEYDYRYQGMEEVILDSPHLEATAKIRFQTSESDGHFFCNPYWIDSVCHLAGFVVNANDTFDLSKQVYVSHGWQSMRFAESLVREKTYRSYVKMQPISDNVMAGDVYILDGCRIIGLCESLKFQCIPRSLLNTFLPPKGAKVTGQSGTDTATKATIGQPKKDSEQALPKPNGQANTQQGPSVVQKVLNIIASEVDVPLPELADPVNLSNLGVDSLMSLSISGRVREELAIEMQSSIFADYPTIGAVKDFLTTKVLGDGAPRSVKDDSYPTSAGSDDLDDLSSNNESISTQLTPPESPSHPGNHQPLSALLRQTIAEGMEIELPELMSIEDLSSNGLDSLMALTLLGTLREKTDLILTNDFFSENRSIRAMEVALDIAPSQPSERKQPVPGVQRSPVAAMKPDVSVKPHEKPTGVAQNVAGSMVNASSVLLQGNLKKATKQLWLIPDGGGAPTSYNFPENIAPSIAVWGLISPFLKTPENFVVGVDGIATIYLAEMKRRQPQGPYHIGGWSAGGVISYEATQQLIAAGDTVETLLLIDTPPPSIIEPLPSSLHRFFGSIGLLGEGDGALEKLPPWLLPHFAASVQALAKYKAKPLPARYCPIVWCMWCEDGVCKTPNDPRPFPYPFGHAQWLLENRTDFGPNEWVELLDEKTMRIEHMEGNHFTMMREPRVGRMVEFLRRALAS